MPCFSFFFVASSPDGIAALQGFQTFTSKHDSPLSALQHAIFHSKSPGTLKIYLAHIKHFIRWTRLYSFPFCPAEPGHVAAYLHSISQRSTTPAYAKQAYFAISWLHSITCFDPPSSPLISSILDYARHTKPAALFQRLPFSADHVVSLINAALQRSSSALSNLRLATLISVAFAGFFRISELLALTWNSISFDSAGALIKIKNAKTDFNRQGQSVHIKSTASPLCPVNFLHSWSRKCGSNLPQDSLVFPALYSRRGRSYVSDSPFAYDAARRELSELLSSVALPPHLYGWHSFRSGGASTAINNGLDPRLVQRHGRWRSSVSLERYVVDSTTRKIDVSGKLFI